MAHRIRADVIRRRIRELIRIDVISAIIKGFVIESEKGILNGLSETSDDLRGDPIKRRGIGTIVTASAYALMILRSNRKINGIDSGIGAYRFIRSDVVVFGAVIGDDRIDIIASEVLEKATATIGWRVENRLDIVDRGANGRYSRSEE